jgi:hypothetical protein
MKQKFSIATAIPGRIASNYMASIFAGIFLFTLPVLSSAQAVSSIITDYNGFWKSYIGAINPKKPDNSHNLLAFTYNGIQYSTGVNDALLTSSGESYVMGDFWALPVVDLSSAPNSNTKAGFGALYDGIVSGPGVTPPEYGIGMYLTDGIKGLNIGTCIANLPSGTITFSISNIQPTSIGDGIPDIVVTQIADPSGSYDRYDFTDENGNRIGNYKDIVFTNITPIANWTADFYEARVHPLSLINGFTQTDRPMRLWAADLSEFGVTAANYTQIRNFRIDLSGQSDVAFVAYNNLSVNFQNPLPVEYSSFKGSVVNGKVKLNWQTVSEQDADKFIIERSEDGINYKAIGSVKANNNAISANNYTFIDVSPLNGRAHYRLKQVDLNGKFHNNSSIIRINNSKDAVSELNVYPNPAKGRVYIEHAVATGTESITVYNASGVVVKQARTSAGLMLTMLDLEKIPAGVYYVSFNDGREKRTARFVVGN